MTNRIEKIRLNLVDKIADAVLITSDENRFYASEMRSSAGYMVVTQRRAVLFLDFRYFEAALKKQSDGKIESDIEIVQMAKAESENIADIMNSEGLHTIALENMSLTAYEYAKLCSELSDYETVGLGEGLNAIRSVKEECEIEKIMHAQRITDTAYEHILGFIKEGIAECDVALELEYFMRKNGAEGVAFDTICVSGEKSSLPHGTPGAKKIGKGFLTMDFGAKFDGYCSDMTRTVCVGKPDEEMKRVYDTVLEAQRLAFEKIRANVIGCEVDKAAREYIYESGYSGCFGHSTGHSLGICIHENPNYSPKSNAVIPENAVLSVEPGVYLQGKFGVRIEDIAVVCKNGYKNLTNSPKHLTIL